jgi:NAD(P)H dehydrogenase (quinone)
VKFSQQNRIKRNLVLEAKRINFSSILHSKITMLSSVIHSSAQTLAHVGEALGLRNLDPQSGKIFITDGLGVVGHRVALKLLNAGFPTVRLGATNPVSMSFVSELGGEVCDFHWSDESTYLKALDGVKSVLITIPYTADWDSHFSTFIDACKHAGVKHIVKLSFYHARVKSDIFHEVPLVRKHGVCDTDLINLVTPQPPLASVVGGAEQVTPGYDMYIRPNMSYTILYASHYMSDPFTFQGRELNSQGTLYGASGNRGVNYVSPNDVAEVATRVLLAPKEYYDKVYTLTGANSIPDKEVATILSIYLDKPIVYTNQPLDEFSKGLKISGDPRFMVEDLVAFERVKSTGTEEVRTFVSNDIKHICGHAPESFEEYLLRTDMMTDIELKPPAEG